MKSHLNFKALPWALTLLVCSNAAQAIKITVPEQYQDQVEAIKEAERKEREQELQGVAEDAEGGIQIAGDGRSDAKKPEVDADEFLVQSVIEATDTASAIEETLAADEGVVSGQIVDKETGEPISGVAILIEGTDVATVTDDGGRYSLGPAPAGTYTLTFVKTGYIEANITEYAVAGGEVSVFPFAMPPRPADMSDEVYELQDFSVTAEQATQMMLEIDFRKDSLAAMDILSSEDFAKFAASDAAEAISKISGASISDGKYVVIRGLNDRYNTTLINGVRLPSPDPDRKAVAMDIFPTSLFEGIIARKTYTSDMPGESSGGSIELRTKSVPDAPFLNLSYGVGMQEQTTGENILSDPERASFSDWLFGDDERGFSNRSGGDELLSDYSNRVGSINFPLMAPVERKAPFDQSFSFSAGGSHEFKDWLTIGAIFGTKMGFKSRSKVTEIDKSNIEEGRFIQDERGVAISGSDEYDVAFLFGLGAQVGEAHTLNYTFLRSDTLSSTAVEKTFKQLDEQVDPNNQLDFVDTEISVEDRMLQAHQFSGEHRIDTGAADDWTLSWFYTAAEMEQSEPDQRLIDNLRLNPDGTLYLPGSNNIERVRSLRFNRNTEQESDMMGVKLESPKFEIGENVVFNFHLGADRGESDRVFEQLETEVNNEAFIFGDLNQSPNPLVYAAVPVPDGAGLASILQQRDYLSDAFSDVFTQDDGSGGINSIIEQIYEAGILNSQASLQVANQNLANANNALSTAEIDFDTSRNNFDTGLIAFVEPGVGYDNFTSSNTYDASVVNRELARLNAGQSLTPGLGFLDLINQEYAIAAYEELQVADAQGQVNTSQGNVHTAQSNLDTLAAEQAQYLSEAAMFIAQISSMPSVGTDPTAFPTYSYFGDENYILNTPVGFSIYTDHSPSNRSNQFPTVTNKYSAIGRSEESSIFISGDLRLFDRLRVAGGVRRESTLLSYDLVDPVLGEPPASTGALGSQFSPFVVEASEIDQRDYLPFLSLIYDVTDDIKLHLAWSRTVAKPTFREIAPFPIFNLTDGSIEYGNPGLTVINEGIIELRKNNGEDLIDEDYVVTPDFAGLDVGNVESRDIRLEWFTPLDGLIAVGYFEKTIGAPIERVQALQINGIDINTFINNNNEADLTGYEFELQQNLGVLGNDLFGLPLSWLTVGGNYTILDAEVERSDFEKGNLTDLRFNGRLIDPNVFQSGDFSTRPLYDQPEYVANAFISLDIEPTGTRITLSQNWLGKQLDRAGGLSGDNLGSADLFWQDFSSLSLVVEQRITDHIKLRFSAKNIDSPVRELAEDDGWNSLVEDGSRFTSDPGTDDPDSAAYQGALTSFGDFRTRQVVEPTYSISISGSF